MSDPDMQLAAGARVGPYEIVSILGTGGMGEVYRARDGRLNRDVAIKVLRPATAGDADRLTRFGREAQLLAALNHPNIAQLHGLEEVEGHPALIMELVEGPTLADRIAAGAIPLEDALPMARQIVEALEAAHAAGIVHRDLKPANIKVRADGTVKVLDFGLAKAFDRDGAAGQGTTTSPTLSMHATAAGIILGTAAYMSPEQARGRPVDRRADTWAFGAVLYEMLAGRRAFDADDTSDTLALVLTKDPNWTALPASTPTAIRRLLRRCLERDPKRRVPDIAVARLEIDEAMAAPEGDSAVSERPADAPRDWRRWVWPFAGGVGLTAALAAAIAWVGAQPTLTPAPVARFGITLPPEQPIAISINDRDLAISPDGTHLVYTAGAESRLMVRPLDRLVPQRLGNITNARAPFVSPDGRWVAFFDRLDEGVTTGPVVGGTLRRVPIAGGPPITIAQVTGASRGASWGPDDSIVFATSDTTTGLLRVPAGGGEPEVLTRPDTNGGEEDHHLPSLLPGGRGVLFTIVSREQSQRRVALLDPGTGRWRTLIQSGSQAEYLETGHLIYVDGGALWAVRFDTSTLQTHGDPVPVLESIARGFVTSLTVSRGGTFAYVPAGGVESVSLVWVDREGREEPAAAPQTKYSAPRISPDGTRVVVSGTAGRGAQLWISDVSFQRLTPLPFSPISPFKAWSHDSRYVYFSSRESPGLVRRAADGTGAEERLTSSSAQQRVVAVSPDGAHLVFEQMTPAFSYDLMVLSLDETSKSTGADAPTSPLLATEADERNASIDPRGRWMAYESNKSGQFEVYVKPFPNVNDAEHQISTDGGRTPLWSPAGGELFYVSGSALMAVTLQTTPVFRVGNPTRLFDAQRRILDGRLLPATTARTFDVSPDGKRFLMLKDATPGAGGSSQAPSIIVVQNWFEELKTRVPSTR